MWGLPYIFAASALRRPIAGSVVSLPVYNARGTIKNGFDGYAQQGLLMSAPNEPDTPNEPDELNEATGASETGKPDGASESSEAVEPSKEDGPSEPKAAEAASTLNPVSAPVEPVVDLQNITMRTDRGGYVFRDLSLTLAPGESAIIVGTSGSGKTMLSKLLLGVAFPERGTVRVFGQEVRKRRRGRIKRIRRRVGGVGGIFGLMPSLTVAENIAYPMILTGTSRKIVKDRMLRMLSEFSLLKLANKYPTDLTRVESHLAQFARAAIANQPLMVIDEPAAGLDPANHARVFSFLVKVALSGRSMVILASGPPSEKIPNTRLLHLTGGVLQ